jgi:hypothetical protein
MPPNLYLFWDYINRKLLAVCGKKKLFNLQILVGTWRKARQPRVRPKQADERRARQEQHAALYTLPTPLWYTSQLIVKVV